MTAAKPNETDVRTGILRVLSPLGWRFWINHVGHGWVGTQTKRTEHTITLHDPRPLTAGLGVGSSDLIGFTPVVITAEMVGSTVAVFTAVEVKSASGRPTQPQLDFVKMVRDAGGIACVARSSQDALVAQAEWVAAHSSRICPS